jgi:hypothetical protein
MFSVEANSLVQPECNKAMQAFASAGRIAGGAVIIG